MKKDKTIQMTISAPYFDGVKSGVIEATFKAKINEQTSIRKAALRALQSMAQVNTAYNLSREISPALPLDINLRQTGHGSHNFRIPYKLNAKGRIIFLNGYDPLSADWTYGEIMQLKKSHYIKGNPKHLIINIPEGLGSFSGEIQKLMLIHEIIGIILGSPITITPQKTEAAIPQNDTIAQEWLGMNLYSLRQIRTLIECKESWTTQEVIQRLGVTEEIANNILSKLGYRLKKNTWKYIPGHNQKAKEEWLKMENVMEQKQQQMIEQFPIKG